MSTTAVSLSRFYCQIGLLCLLSMLNTQVAAKTVQQKVFLEAEKALINGQTHKLQQLKLKLAGYPLLPYLDYQALKRKLSSANEAEVKNFLQRYKGTPIADTMRRHWLDHLARQSRWKAYRSVYTPQGNIRRQCQYMHALIKTGSSDKAWPKIEKIWLHGKSRPSACDSVFKAWENAGKRTTELTWKRINLAMEAGQWRLARYLGKSLSNKDNVWLKRWIRIHQNPKAVLRVQDFSKTHPYREIMLSHAIRRMARFDGLESKRLWSVVKPRYEFDADLTYKTSRRIALALERKEGPDAYNFVKSLKPKADDDRLHAAHLHAALLRQDWPQVLLDLKQWPAASQQKLRLRYWRARALLGTGQQQVANTILSELAKERSYYGFLAADLIDSPYHLAHSDTPITAADHNAVITQAGVQRALELHALGRDVNARREWRYATKGFNKAQLKAAAKIAQSIDWHDQAIFTLAKTKYWDDLELRFPVEHTQWVEQQAQKLQLDDAWIYAVMRQESAFMRDARSHVGAMGLMQLMPATARSVARKLKQKPPSKTAILKVQNNIKLGSNYLKQLLDRHDNSPVLATAAYNAGPHRVDKWIPNQTLPADVWVDLVPYKETRRYVRRVLSYMVIYDKRLGKKPTRLQYRMAPIQAAGSKIAKI